MTENTTTTGGADTDEAAEAETQFVGLQPSEPEAGLPEELIEIDDDEDGADDEEPTGSGAVSGGFGFAGIAFGLVSLTTNWVSTIVSVRSQDNADVHFTAQETNQQFVDLAHQGWQTQAWWSLAFAAAAVLFGAGALLSPSILLSGRTPGWAKGAAVGALIVGLVGVLFAVLTIVGVFGGTITVPATPAQ